MSKKFTDHVVSGYLAEPEQSRFGVINAFYDQGSFAATRQLSSQLKHNGVGISADHDTLEPFETSKLSGLGSVSA